MIEKVKYIMGKKSFHKIVVATIVSVLILFLIFVLIRYSVEGETNPPFNLTKITIVSSTEGVEKDSGENRWAFDISQNADIYISLQKNGNFQKKEAIKSILIDNIKVEKKELGTIDFYRPNINEEGATFKNSDENKVENIEYTGAMESNLKELKVGNQGGTIIFRCANNKVAEYTSNDEVIVHNELLKKAGLTEEDVKGTITFDFTIKLESGKEYKTSITKEIPTEGLIENGKSAVEITDLDDIVFKRIKN